LKTYLSWSKPKNLEPFRIQPSIYRLQHLTI